MMMNDTLKGHEFLADMLKDAYFPTALVQKGQQILLRLCEKIETDRPNDLAALYAITHASTEEFNALAEEFEDQDSEIETAARDSIGSDFALIAKAYGFDADIEELISTRDW
jgi:hypothetical protein